MAERTCAACGAVVGTFADRCPGCGADPAVRLIELGPDPAARRGRGRSPAPRPARPPPGSWRRWAPIGAVVVAAWSVVALATGDPDPTVDEAADGAREAPTTTGDRASGPTTRSGTATTQVVEGAPFLGEPVGLQLALLGESTHLLDLDTGTLRLLSRVQVFGMTTLGLLVSAPDLAVWPPPYDGSDEIPVDDTPVEQAWVASGGQRVWYVRRTFGSPLVTVARHDLLLGETATHDLAPSSWPVGVLGTDLVLQAPGGTYLLGGDGSAERISTGDVYWPTTGTSPDWLLVHRCDERLACGLDLLDAAGRVTVTHPDPTPTALHLGGPGPDTQEIAVSRTGRLATLRAADVGYVLAVDGVELTPVVVPRGLAWSPDGRWVVALDGPELVALDTSAAGGLVRIALRESARASWGILLVPTAP